MQTDSNDSPVFHLSVTFPSPQQDQEEPASSSAPNVQRPSNTNTTLRNTCAFTVVRRNQEVVSFSNLHITNICNSAINLLSIPLL